MNAPNSTPESSAGVPIRLTQYRHGAGCGCKISPKVLDVILAGSGAQHLDPRLWVSTTTTPCTPTSGKAVPRALSLKARAAKSWPIGASVVPALPRSKSSANALLKSGYNLRLRHTGEVAEWSNVPDSKSGVVAISPWVRIPPSPPVSKQTSALLGAFLFLSTILSTNSHGHWIGFGWIESDEHFEPRCRRQCTEHRSHRLYRQQSNVARLFAEPAFFADSAEKAICLINETGKSHFRMALLHKPEASRDNPSPRRSYATAGTGTVAGRPSCVKRLSKATRTCSSVTWRSNVRAITRSPKRLKQCILVSTRLLR